jgi:hypothetical protein
MMKKTLCIMLVLFACAVALAGCDILGGNDASTSTITTVPTAPVYTYPKEYLPGSIELINAPPEYDEFNLFQPPYRFIYKTFPDEYGELVGAEVCQKWLLEEVVRDEITDDPTEMMLVSFVKYFDIPKADFIAVTEKLRQSMLDSGMDISNEEYEIPNPDIIYTLDNEIIDEYYRKE